MVTMPELTFETGVVLNMGNGEGGGAGAGGREGGGGWEERKRIKDLLFPLQKREGSLLQTVSGRVCCYRTLCYRNVCCAIARFLLFVIFHSSLGPDSSRGFSEMDSSG